MPGAPIQVGPFIGGLNTFSDPTAIADNELTVCQNFELDLDGSLKSRPPIENLGVNFPLDTTGNINILGYFYTATGTSYLLASDGKNSTYSFDGNTWTLITATMSGAAMVQFDDKAWITAPIGSLTPSGYWTPGGGFVADNNMPLGDSIVSFKGRLWIAEGKDSTNQGTRLYRSKTLADPALWVAVNDFVDVGSGDGQNIVQLAVYFNTLLIFRVNSIYGLQYTSDPAAATISLVVPNVGLNSKEALDQFESFIYFMYEDKAYEFSNNRAAQINVKVPFRAGTTSGIYLPFAVSEFNRRIVFSFYDNTFVYSLRTRTWTTWKSDTFGAVGKIVRRESGNEALPVAVTHSSASVAPGGSRVAPTLFITDATTTAAENMECIIQTKNFNYQASSIYKRLFWWGLDAQFRGDVEATAYPVTYSFSVSWQQLLDGGNWGTLLPFTWGQPQTEAPSTETDISVGGNALTRTFVKFLKSLRFRQIYFRVKFETDGSTTTAPVRLFSLMTYVNPKQTVSKEIT